MSEQSRLRAGFTRLDLQPHISSKTTFRTPLEAICAVLASGETTLCLVSLDLISPPDGEAIRSRVGARLGIPPENVQLHATHVHSAPWAAREGAQVLSGLPEALADAADEAASRAVPVGVRSGWRDVGQTLSLYRRGDAGPDLGVQTFWYGYTFREGDDRPDASALASEMRSRWLGKAPEYHPGEHPVWFDGPVDSLVQALELVAGDGATVGCLVRFSAHPHMADHCNPWRYDADFPGVVRREVGRRRGGPVMFLNGACGDLVPKERVRFVVDPERVEPLPYAGPCWWLQPAEEAEQLAEIERIGQAVAHAALDALEGQDLDKGQPMRLAAGEFACPLDPHLPRSPREAELLQAALAAEYHAARRQGSPLRELRGLANRLNWCRWSGDLGFEHLSEAERAAGEKRLPLAALALGRTVLAFMHSEVMVGTTLALRRRFPDLDLWTMGLSNADVGYLPTREMIDEGGYEGRSTIFSAEAEEAVRGDVAALIERLVP